MKLSEEISELRKNSAQSLDIDINKEFLLLNLKMQNLNFYRIL